MSTHRSWRWYDGSKSPSMARPVSRAATFLRRASRSGTGSRRGTSSSVLSGRRLRSDATNAYASKYRRLMCKR
eukprot:1340847-Heterocapsa_arctica.AAC.1